MMSNYTVLLSSEDSDTGIEIRRISDILIRVYDPELEPVAEFRSDMKGDGIFEDRWMGYLDGEAFREVCEKAYLPAYEDFRLPGKVCNVRRMEGGLADELPWFNTEFLPRLGAAGLKCTAIALPEEFYAKLSFEVSNDDFVEMDPERMHGILTWTCNSYEKALEWVRENTPKP